MLDSRLILERFYRVRPPRVSWRRRLGRMLGRMADWVDEQQWRLLLGITAVVVWGAGHVYYYNRLTVLEFDCRAAYAQIEASQQKRNHIQRNLVRLLEHYATYERKLMKDVTKLRADDEKKPNAPNPAPSSDPSALGPEGLLGRLNAVAEQYPNLHLTKTTQQFSAAIIASESEIGERIVRYNDAVNMYTTVLNQFPGNLFGKMVGFESLDFYEPENRAVLNYRELDL